MPFESLSQNLNLSGQKLQEYIKNTAEYYKLRLFKSSMKFATSLINMLVLGSMFMMFLFFFSFGIAFWIGEALGHLQYGLLVVAGFYLIIFVLIFIFAKPIIVKTMLGKFSDLIINDPMDAAQKTLFEDDVEPEELRGRHETENNPEALS